MNVCVWSCGACACVCAVWGVYVRGGPLSVSVAVRACLRAHGIIAVCVRVVCSCCMAWRVCAAVRSGTWRGVCVQPYMAGRVCASRAGAVAVSERHCGCACLCALAVECACGAGVYAAGRECFCAWVCLCGHLVRSFRSPFAVFEVSFLENSAKETGAPWH